jgi:hypothetical protein
MRNKILLLAAFLTTVVLFVVYMVPKIETRNNLDALMSVLNDFRNDLPEDKIVWFIAKDTNAGPPEIYYKVQFALAPRVVITPGELRDVPSGGRILFVDDLAKTGREINLDAAQLQGSAFSVNRAGFNVTLFTKK